MTLDELILELQILQNRNLGGFSIKCASESIGSYDIDSNDDIVVFEDEKVIEFQY